MTKREMMKEIERLTAELHEARRDCAVAKNNHAKAMQTLNEIKSAFGDVGDWLLSQIEREIDRCEWERKNVYFVGALKAKIKALRKIEKFVRKVPR